MKVGGREYRLVHALAMTVGPLATVMPQLIPMVPAPYKDLATAIAAVLTALAAIYTKPPEKVEPEPPLIVPAKK